MACSKFIKSVAADFRTLTNLSMKITNLESFKNEQLFKSMEITDKQD